MKIELNEQETALMVAALRTAMGQPTAESCPPTPNAKPYPAEALMVAERLLARIAAATSDPVPPDGVAVKEWIAVSESLCRYCIADILPPGDPSSTISDAIHETEICAEDEVEEGIWAVIMGTDGHVYRISVASTTSVRRADAEDIKDAIQYRHELSGDEFECLRHFFASRASDEIKDLRRCFAHLPPQPPTADDEL